MTNGIDNRADVPTLRIDKGIRLSHQTDAGGFDAGVHRHEIIGLILIEIAALAGGDFGRFMQGPNRCPNRDAHDLATGGARVDDMSGGKCPGDSWHPDILGVRANADFDKFSIDGNNGSAYMAPPTVSKKLTTTTMVRI
jgi:hypothetical protein